MDGNSTENLKPDSEKTLDALLENYMAPPKDLAQRICASCKAERELEEQFLTETAVEMPLPRRRRRRSYDVACRIAAAFVLVGCVLALAYRSGKKTQAENMVVSHSSDAMQMSAPAQPPELIASALPSTGNASLGFSLQDSLALMQKNTSSEQNIMAVSTNGAMPHAKKHSQLAPVANEITHVWIAKNASDIRQFLNGDSEDLDKTFTPDENGVITLGITADDTSIQALVDELYNSGHWKLVSATSPQPNQGDITPLDGHPVIYTLRIAGN